MEEEVVITTLTDEQCWELLESQSIGRLAFHMSGEVHIVPINYVTEDRKALIFRTAEGNKLLGLHMCDDVAFEVDEIREDSGSSVVLRGHAATVPMSEDGIADDLGLRPWVPTDKFNVVRISVTQLSGRLFAFDK